MAVLDRSAPVTGCRSDSGFLHEFNEGCAGASSTLRVGVVGAGVMGSNHARVLMGLPGITMVGIVDPLPAHRTRRDRNWSVAPSSKPSTSCLDAGVDAVTVAAPTHLHHEIYR